MALMPILGREFRSRSRSGVTYWSRFGVALVGTVVCVSQPALPGGSGRNAFNAVVGAAFLFSCATCLLAADAISGERRQGTLGLLLLTRARTLDVLLGKLSSVAFLAFWALAASLPVLLVPIAAGGITAGEALRTGLALVCTMSLSTSAGLSMACWRVNRARAIRYTLGLMFVLLFAPVLAQKLTGPTMPPWYVRTSPLMGLHLSETAAYEADTAAFWQSMASTQALALALVVAAGIWLRQTAGSTDVRARPAPVPIAFQEGFELTRWEPGRHSSSPVEWLAFRQHGVRAVFWIPTVCLMALSAWVPVVMGPVSLARGSSWLRFWPFGIVGALGGGAVIAWMSSRFLVGARSSRELEVLMTTPVGADRLFADQWDVLKRLFLRPVIAMELALAIPALALGGGLATALLQGGLIMVPLSVAVSGFTVACLCWVGMGLALRISSHASVIAVTVILVVAGSWLVRLLGSVICAVLIGTAGPAGFLIAEATVMVFLIALLNYSRKGVNTQIGGLEP